MRLACPYDVYKYARFAIPLGRCGDSFDRYLLRVEEMRNSLIIIDQCLNMWSHAILPFPSKNSNINISFNKITPPSRYSMKYFMESLIHHFKLYSEGFNLPKEDTYTVVEAPKGEFGIYLLSEGENRPYRCRIKSPGFMALQGLDFMAQGLFLSDLITLIGTQDLVFGEIDR